MQFVCYRPQTFQGKTKAILDQAMAIIEEYAADNLDITLRQLYYQFVARGWLPNKQANYKRLGDIVTNGRYSGCIPWDCIVDRTRAMRENSHWGHPREIMQSAVDSYREDLWDEQVDRLEVWIEKDALAGILQRVCPEEDVAWFSCRGYTSASEMWVAAMRLERYAAAGQDVHIIHLGDHDPSGLDMTRDIQDRLNEFIPEAGVQVHRIALNLDQVRRLNPPPNPVKLQDSRAAEYIRRYDTRECWELDALDPRTLMNLVRDAITDHRNVAVYEQAVQRQEENRDKLKKVAKRLK